MLHDDRRVGHKGPEVIGLKPRVALQMGEECWWIGVIIGICARVVSRRNRKGLEAHILVA